MLIPTPPEKQIRISAEEEIESDVLEDILIVVRNLIEKHKHFDLKTSEIQISENFNHCTLVSFCIFRPNPNYEKELEQYYKDLAVYQKYIAQENNKHNAHNESLAAKSIYKQKRRTQREGLEKRIRSCSFDGSITIDIMGEHYKVSRIK